MYELRLDDTGAEAVIEGVLVPFDGPADSYGTTFGAETDYALDWFAERPLLFHHGLTVDAGISPVGRIVSLTSTRAGLTMRAILDRSGRFYARIKQQITAGALFLSSGAMAHLTRFDAAGRALCWPVVEGSLTPTPSSPRATITSAELRAHYRAAGIALDETLLGVRAWEAEARRQLAHLQTHLDRLPTAPQPRAMRPLDIEAARFLNEIALEGIA